MCRPFVVAALASLAAVAACSNEANPPSLGGGGGIPVGGGGGGGNDSGATGDSGAMGEVVDNLVIDTLVPDGGIEAGPVSGAVNLSIGSQYVLVVTGTYSIWLPSAWQSVCAGMPEASPQFRSSSGDTGQVGLDPAWVFAWPMASTTYCPNGMPIGPAPRANAVLSVSVDVGSTWSPTMLPREATFQTSHAYHFDITGAGHPVSVKIEAVGQYGQLHVAVAKGS